MQVFGANFTGNEKHSTTGSFFFQTRTNLQGTENYNFIRDDARKVNKSLWLETNTVRMWARKTGGRAH